MDAKTSAGEGSVAAGLPEHRRPEGLGRVAVALWAQDRGRRVAGRLSRAGVPVMLLKGPDLQVRLFGTPAAYPSGDLDVLVPRAFAERARAVLEGEGWRFERNSGLLWRWSAAATFSRDGFYLDLHWGLHAAHLPSGPFREIERALWRGAAPGSSGMLEPPPEALIVYLAVHAAGHGFERPEWRGCVQAAAPLVRDWDAVWDLAARSRTTGALRACLEADAQPPSPVLDGRRGRAIWALSWVARGHFVPQHLRGRLREAVVLGREGHGYVSGRKRRPVTWAGVRLEVPRGVFGPSRVAPGLIELTLEAVADRERPLIVDVGTGTGVIALAVASSRRDARVLGVDTSARAIRAARRNRRRQQEGRVRFHVGSLLEPVAALDGPIDVVVAYLPFVDPRESERVRGERPASPRASIEGAEADGLGLIRRLCSQAADALTVGGTLVLALPPAQWDEVNRFAARLGLVPGRRVAIPGVPEVCGCLIKDGGAR